jgi:methyltransferase family protein
MLQTPAPPEHSKAHSEKRKIAKGTKMNREAHWDTVYSTKAENQVSWFEALPSVSLEMIDAAGVAPETCLIDVGGGESHLIDVLLARGLECLAVLDVSKTAIQHAQARIGAPGQVVTWLLTDVTAHWFVKPMDIWHDRAVFHFLIDAEDRRRYRERLRQTLKVRGTAIIATFAPDGPKKCSGLPVARYSPESLGEELGAGFILMESRRHIHRTPWGTDQAFQYSRFSRLH